MHDVSLLEDEVTRLHYFLQLKLDVIEGRLRCNYEQAIVLASYSLQAEFGDHDPEKHTLEYLQDFPLLPKPMLTQFPEDKIGTLTDAIISQHASLRGIQQQLAEVYYIVGAQQLDGYGQECFLAKDEHGSEVLIGASLTGIVVRKGNRMTPQFFKWHDITNLVNHKRYFGIECQNYEFSVQFMLDEPDSAKYVWKMCVLQHTFYKMHASAETNELNITLENNTHQIQPPDHAGLMHQQQANSQQIQHQFQQQQQQQQPPIRGQPHHQAAAGQFELMLEHGGLANAFPTTIQQSEIQSFHQQTQRVDITPIKLSKHSAASSGGVGGGGSGSGTQPLPYPQHMMLMDEHNNTTLLQQSYNNYVLGDHLQQQQHQLPSADPAYGNILPPPQSAPGQPPTATSGSLTMQDAQEQQYRPVPDYETAIRNKYGTLAPKILQQQQQQLPLPLNSGATNLHSSQQALYTSQPSLVADALLQQHQNQLQLNLASIEAQRQLQQQQQQRGLALNYQQPQQPHLQPQVIGVVDQNAYSSTPELNRMNLNNTVPQHGLQHQLSYPPQAAGNGDGNAVANDQIVAELQRLNLYKPPPPYPGPYAKLASTSTPDLAGANLNYGSSAPGGGSGGGVVGMGGSSPDLVSRRNLPSEGNLHRTFDNLNDMSRASAAQMDLTANDYRNAFSTEELNNYHKTAQQSAALSLHDTSNLAARKPSATSAAAAASHGFVTAQLTQQSCNEPIYQNQQQLAEAVAAAGVGADGEPIYQNLPVHEKILYKQRLLRQKQEAREKELEEEMAAAALNDSGANESIHIDETVESVGAVKPSPPPTQKIGNASSPSYSVQPRLKGHVSRVAITNSRENLQYEEDNFIQTIHSHEREEAGAQPPQPRKSVTKISIGRGSDEIKSIGESNESGRAQRTATTDDEESRQSVISDSVASSSETAAKNSNLINGGHKFGTVSSLSAAITPSGKRKQFQDPFFATPSSGQKAPRTPSSKPRAGRKRWALNFGSKTGSLKSIKSESGASHKSQDSLDGSSTSGRGGFGPMMLATLHGLTRSRPDLLAESVATFSKPSKMPKDEIGSHLEAKLAEGEVLREFERIPKKKLEDCHFNTAVQLENIPRSRFKDVLPYEENRVRLTNPDKENKTGFINASHVSATIGPDAQRFYIAAQGPMPSTVLHFWQMILQCDVHLVVMLTDASTSAKTSSCIPYWPSKSGSTVEIGDFKIVNRFSSAESDGGGGGGGAYVTSTLHMTHTPSKRQRQIWHIQYTDWSDHGCPSDARNFLEFLGEMSALRRHTSSASTEMPVPGQNRNPPVLVHCSAGVGRTGVAVLCDILLYCVDHNLDIDIPKVLSHLRQQRMLMVQTVAQYKFVHTVLIQYLKQSRLI